MKNERLSLGIKHKAALREIYIAKQSRFKLKVTTKTSLGLGREPIQFSIEFFEVLLHREKQSRH